MDARGTMGVQAGTYSVDAQDATGVQVGDRNTQIIYNYTRLTWTDGVAPPPLASVSGEIDSPYRGISAFEERDAPFFFGREADATQVLERISQLVNEAGLLVVSGVSGAGKSSLLRAGVLPRLRGAGLASTPESASWPCLIFTPSHAPLDELAIRVGSLADTDAATIRRSLHADPAGFALTARQAALMQSGRSAETANGPPPESQRLLLIIDQFEQLFTQCSDDEQRQAFITALHAAATDSGPRQVPTAMVVLAVRADFEARCVEYPQLADAIQSRFLLTSMTGRQLMMAITEPAKRAGSSVDEDLVKVLLREISSRQQGQPDAISRPGTVFGAGVLPLLSHALDQAWRNRIGDILTLADYERTGGIEGAVADSAQRAYNRLSRGEQKMARQIFTRLTATSSDGLDTADRVARPELTKGKTGADVGDVEAVLEAFAAERLLTLAAGTVEISHEVLLTAWPLLRDTWLAETHSDRVICTRLYNVAADWERDSYDPSYLYSGSLLEAATDVADRIDADPARYPPLSSTERRFLRASDRARRRRARRRQGIIALLTALVVGLAAVAFLALRSRQDAINQSDTAVSGQLISQIEALGDNNPVLSRLESLAAWRIRHSSQASYAMLNVAARPEIATLPTRYGQVQWAAFWPGGKVLATLTSGGMVQLWDTSTGQLIKSPITGVSNTIEVTAAFGAGGKILATENSVSFDVPGGPVRLWDVATGRQIGSLPRSSAGTQIMTFSPDGKTLAAIGLGNGVQLYDVDKRQQIPGPDIDNNGQVNWMVFSPDGKILATEEVDGAVRLWDAGTRKQIGRALGGGVQGLFGGLSDPIAFSPDGKSLAAISGDDRSDSTVQVWDIATRQKIGNPGITGADSVAFSPDSSTLAIGTDSGAVRLWNLADRDQVGSVLSSSTAPIDTVAFSPDGKTLVSGGDDGIARLWNMRLATVSMIGIPSTGADPLGTELSPDGKTLAAATPDDALRLWDAAGRKWLSGPLPDTASDVFSTAFSPDSKTLAVGLTDGSVLLWDVAADRQIGRLNADPSGGSVGAEAFSPDGKTLAVAISEDGTVELWNLTARRQIGKLTANTAEIGNIDTVAFSPDGKTLAVDSGGTAELWNLPKRHQTGVIITGDGSNSNCCSDGLMAFSSDSTTLLTAGSAGIVQMWDVATGQQIVDPITGVNAQIDTVAFSPDSKTLATGTADGTVDLWDLATGQQIGTPLTGNGGYVMQVIFSPDGRTLEAVARKTISVNLRTLQTVVADTVERWDVAYLVDPVHYLCASTGGPVTRAQWTQYVQGPAYGNVCT